MKSEIINKPLLILVGPTAVGKTALSLAIAKRFYGEIVSVDSMQVYRYMDIGTAKATSEERKAVPHHLIDIVNPNENYDAARFTFDSLKIIRDIHDRGKLPILAGGTGLYVQALLHGIFSCAPADEAIRSELRRRLEIGGVNKLHEELRLYDRISADKINSNDSQRVVRALEILYTTGVPWSVHLKEQAKQTPAIKFTNLLKIGLTCDRQQLYERINNRCRIMIDSGLENEVKNLLASGYDKTLKSLGSIGYRHMVGYLDKKYPFPEMVRLLARDTRRYAKRQYTWFEKMDNLLWFDVSNTNKIHECVHLWVGKEDGK